MNTLRFSAAVSVDKGHVRANNEDNIYFNGVYLNSETRDGGITLRDEPEGCLFVYAVFDGMGGEAYGEEASLIAASVTHELHQRCVSFENVDTDRFIGNVVEVANERICARMQELGSGRMGATMALIVVFNNTMRVYNVGDSRVYLHRNGTLSQISVDDSFAQRLYRMGMITREEAENHKDRNKLIQHLGIDKKEMIIQPHKSNNIPLRPGDKILICSDGLTDMVTAPAINTHLMSAKPPEEICEELVCDALANGGKDNVSVIVVDVAVNPDRAKSNPEVLRVVFLVIIALIVLAIGTAVGFLTADILLANGGLMSDALCGLIQNKSCIGEIIKWI